MLQLHVCISGFTQHPGRNHGLVNLSEIMLDKGFSCGRSSRVWLHPWNSDWSQLAEHAFRLASGVQDDWLIGVYAYSWGAGHGAIEFANELLERGVSVRAMVLSDPVPRPIAPLRWLALLPGDWPSWIRPAIVIPPNVREVYSFYQRLDLPQGGRPVPKDSASTIIHEPMQLGCNHAYMDDAKPFHRTALLVANQIRREAK